MFSSVERSELDWNYVPSVICVGRIQITWGGGSMRGVYVGVAPDWVSLSVCTMHDITTSTEQFSTPSSWLPHLSYSKCTQTEKYINAYTTRRKKAGSYVIILWIWTVLVRVFFPSQCGFSPLGVCHRFSSEEVWKHASKYRFTLLPPAQLFCT